MAYVGKKFEPDPSKSWEDRYKDLEKHHVEETTALYEKLKELRRYNERLEEEIEDLNMQLSEYELSDDFDE